MAKARRYEVADDVLQQLNEDAICGTPMIQADKKKYGTALRKAFLICIFNGLCGIVCLVECPSSSLITALKPNRWDC